MEESGGLTAQVAPGPIRCRCGTWIPEGVSCFHFAQPQGPVAALVSEHLFCSVVCARAYLLEALELVQATKAVSVLQDLEEVRAGLGWLYAQLAQPAPL